jgi:hypothetical protein
MRRLPAALLALAAVVAAASAARAAVNVVATTEDLADLVCTFGLVLVLMAAVRPLLRRRGERLA